MIKICIDPGHGGKSRFNVGPNGYIEADGVLKISLYLKEELSKSNAFQVILTRSSDKTMGLTERAKVAVNNKCDMFISEHTNAGAANAGGTEVYYSVDIPGDKALAEKFSRLIAGALGIKDRGARTRGTSRNPNEDYYTVIDVAQDGGVKHVFLIEAAFHSNSKEEKLLLQDKYLRKIAKAQADAIFEFYGIKIKEDGEVNPPATVPPIEPKPEPKPVRNENVIIIQRLANELGIMDMDGRKLVEDGIIGPRTRYAVQELPVLSLSSNQGTAIKYIQNRLNELQYTDYAGRTLEVDGLFGRRTRYAVKKFQKGNKIVVDGIVGPETWLKFLYV